LTPREVAEEITTLIESASLPVPRFEASVMQALHALVDALHSGTDADAVQRPVRVLEHALTGYGEKMARYFELLLPQLRECVAANKALQNDESDWSKSWCLSPTQPAGKQAPLALPGRQKAKPCTQKTCQHHVIRGLCQHLNDRWAAVSWVLEMVQGLAGSIAGSALPVARTADPMAANVVADLVTALQGPLVGLLKRCPCSSLQHVALGTLLRMREEFAHLRAQRAFRAAPHARNLAIYQHMLVGSHPLPPNGYPDFRGSDDYPLTAAEYAKIVPPQPDGSAPVRTGAIVRALHSTVHHIRVHL
jgi:hypothetical protein